MPKVSTKPKVSSLGNSDYIVSLRENPESVVLLSWSQLVSLVRQDMVSQEDFNNFVEQNATSGSVAADNFIYSENPLGNIDNYNKDFSLLNEPEEGSVKVFLNGLRQCQGLGNDFVINNSTLTFNFALQEGDYLLVDYILKTNGTN